MWGGREEREMINEGNRANSAYVRVLLNIYVAVAPRPEVPNRVTVIAYC